MADPRVKQIKIKTGVVKRLTKEKLSYEKESAALQGKVEKMKADGKDIHDIRKQTEVCKESQDMIPDTKRRLTKAYDELDDMLKKETDLVDLEEYKAAKKALEEAAIEKE